MATLTLPTAARLQARRTRRAAATVPVGVWYMVVAALAFSAMNALVKAVATELPTMEIVFARTVFMAVVTLAMLRREGVSPLGHNRVLLFARGAIGATALSLLYFALGRMPLGDATTLHYTAPVWTALTAAFFLRERIGKWVAAGTAVSLVGVVMIAQPQILFGGPGLDPLAVGAAVGASVLAGGVYTVVRKLRETDHPLVVVFSLAWVGAVGSLPDRVAPPPRHRHRDSDRPDRADEGLAPPARGSRDSHRLRPDRVRLRAGRGVLRHDPECVEPRRRRAGAGFGPPARTAPAFGLSLPASVPRRRESPTRRGLRRSPRAP